MAQRASRRGAPGPCCHHGCMDLVERRDGELGHRHPWEQARRRLIVDLTARAAADRSLSLVDGLDIGSGDAWLAERLADDLGLARVDALDIAYSDEDLQTLRSEHVVPVRECPDSTYDVAFLLDVIEHVADDVALLQLAREHLRESGIVVVSVPAWPRLATSHDIALGHHRRYTPSTLRAAIEASGLVPTQIGGAFSLLLPVRAAQRALEHRRGARDLPHIGSWEGGALTSNVTSAILRADVGVGRQLAASGLPAPGLSLWAVASLPR